MAVSFHFSGLTWRFRLGAYLRSLARPRLFVPILLVALFPVMIDRVVNLLVTGGSMFVPFLVIGLGAALLLIMLGAIVVVLLRSPPSTVTFDEGGIREEIGGRTIEHTWQWIVDVAEDDRQVTLHCREPMRSFELASSTRLRQLVIDKSNPDIARLAVLLATHTSHSPLA